jgi:hypothetical protein
MRPYQASSESARAGATPALAGNIDKTNAQIPV